MQNLRILTEPSEIAAPDPLKILWGGIMKDMYIEEVN